MSFIADSTKSYAGTCQACGCQHSLTKGSLVVHHGYERPGTGYIVGDCRGAGELPYELSCEIAKAWAAHVADSIARWESELYDLENDLVDVILWQNTLTSREPKEGFSEVRRPRGGIAGYSKILFFDVRRDHVPSKDRGEKEGSYGYSGHDFAYYRRTRIDKLCGWLSMARSDLVSLNRSIEAWVYAPERLHVYEGRKKAVVVHLARDTGVRGAACSLRLRRAKVATNADEVTCTRCRSRL